MAHDITLPKLGDGISGGIVASIIAEKGQSYEENDPIIEIETDKAVLPVPTPVTGECLEILVSDGEEIQVGQVIARFEAGEAKNEAPPAETNDVPSEKVEEKVAEAPKPEEKPQPLAQTPPPAPAQPTPPVTSQGGSVPAGPAARKLARELGLDIRQVNGTARGGRITIDDVKNHVKTQNQNPVTRQGSAAPAPAALPDFSSFGEVKREPMSTLRKIVSARMTENWNRIPHVYQFQDVDITNIVKMQQTWAEDFKAAGSSASPTNFIIKALAMSLKEFPQFNASLDEVTQEIVYKNYFNIGVAVDTPSGLIVPVLKNVDRMTIFEIGKEIRDLARKTRERKVTPDDLTGGSITLSNLGGIGGTQFTPIINWPEVAILGVARTETKPLYIEGKFVPRSVVTLCLSYDHRVIDGADGARFIMYLKDTLENMERTLLGH